MQEARGVCLACPFEPVIRSQLRDALVHFCCVFFPPRICILRRCGRGGATRKLSAPNGEREANKTRVRATSFCVSLFPCIMVGGATAASRESGPDSRVQTPDAVMRRSPNGYSSFRLPSFFALPSCRTMDEASQRGKAALPWPCGAPNISNSQSPPSAMLSAFPTRPAPSKVSQNLHSKSVYRPTELSYLTC